LTVVPEEMKFVPFTVRVKALPSAFAELGLRLVIVGEAVPPEPDPPGSVDPPDPHPESNQKLLRTTRAKMMEWVSL
jgi:hypothetical protein